MASFILLALYLLSEGFVAVQLLMTGIMGAECKNACTNRSWFEVKGVKLIRSPLVQQTYGFINSVLEQIVITSVIIARIFMLPALALLAYYAPIGGINSLKYQVLAKRDTAVEINAWVY